MQMKYETIKTYTEEKFRRISGVKRETFTKMVAVLAAAYKIKVSDK